MNPKGTVKTVNKDYKPSPADLAKQAEIRQRHMDPSKIKPEDKAAELDIPETEVEAHDVTIVLGNYGTAARGEVEALQFRKADVIYNRSLIFPNPGTYKVGVIITNVELFKRDNGALDPFGLKITMAVTGEDKAVAQWTDGVKAKVAALM